MSETRPPITAGPIARLERLREDERDAVAGWDDRLRGLGPSAPLLGLLRDDGGGRDGGSEGERCGEESRSKHAVRRRRRSSGAGTAGGVAPPSGGRDQASIAP